MKEQRCRFISRSPERTIKRGKDWKERYAFSLSDVGGLPYRFLC